MRVLIDIAHPAHVHFYRHLRAELVARGDHCLVVSRDKDVTVDLLDRFGIPHVPVGRSGDRPLVGHAVELVRRDLELVRLGRRFRPDVVLTRNPAGVHAARVLGVPGVFDTDDGTSAGVHWRAAAPFASVITTPACLGEDHGVRHWTYESFKALAFLHPDRFAPDPTVRARLGVGDAERLFVVRFVAMEASHDVGERGLPDATRRAVVERLRGAGRVVISSERPLPADLAPLGFPLGPTDLHDTLAAADLVVGDSLSVSAEAALLGTPALRASSFSGRIGYLQTLEDRYGLLQSFGPDEGEAMLAAIEGLLADPDTPSIWAARRAEMLAEQVDLTSWYLDLVDLVGRRRR